MRRPGSLTRHRAARCGLAISAVTALVACGSTGGDVTPAAFPRPAVTLTIGVPDPPGRYIYAVTEEFAKRVTAASDGGLVLEVEEVEISERRWNQGAIKWVQDGSVDLLVVQSQAFDALDVQSFVPLYIPFLITDEEHLDAVLTDDVVDDLLAGLDGIGLTGLGIVPGGMRHLFNEETAPARPEDITGEGVRIAYSTTLWSMIEAAGGRPDDPNGNDLEAAYRDGRVSHLDSTFQLVDGFLARPKAAADIALYPMAFAIVANDEAMGDLSGDHKDLLRTTAREVAQWAAQTRPSDAEEAQALCERSPGAEVVLAGEEARQEWISATAGLAAELRSDPAVDRVAETIARIGAKLPDAAATPAACSGGATAEAPTTANVPETFPDGVYRKEVSAEQLIAGGVNAAVAHMHAGVWTLTFRDGVFDDPGCPGSTYEIVDDRLVVTLGPEGPDCGTAAGLVLFNSGWRLEGDAMTFTDVGSGHGNDVLIENLFGAEPWTRIG